MTHIEIKGSFKPTYRFKYLRHLSWNAGKLVIYRCSRFLLSIGNGALVLTLVSARLFPKIDALLTRRVKLRLYIKLRNS